MNHRLGVITRKLAPILAAGILLQTGGCTTNNLLVNVFSAVTGSVIQEFVFGAFNLI